MRAYFFGNHYLSSIQQGIQSAHCISDMFMRYRYSGATEVGDHLNNWAANHKTMILLNGGYDSSLQDLFGFFDNGDNPYPYMHFNESEEAMGGMLTSIAIIIPEKIYEIATRLRKQRRGWSELSQNPPVDGEGIAVLTTDSLKSKFNQNPKTRQYWELTAWEMELVERLNTFGLAR